MKRTALRRRTPLRTRRPAFPWGLEAKGEDRCRVCGGWAHHLHHAVPRSMSKAARTDLRNGLPLCWLHHADWHAGVPIGREVFTEAEWEFLSSVELVGEDIGAFLDRRYPVRVSGVSQ